MSVIKSPSLLANRWLLVVCLVLPWINPFTSAPSTSVIPLLLSWMLAACALLLVVDEVPTAKNAIDLIHCFSEYKSGIFLALWLMVLATIVPEFIDRALTVGVLASLTCVWISMQIGKRVANCKNDLINWLLISWLTSALTSSLFAFLQRINLAYYLFPWIVQSPAGIGFANLRQQNQFATLTSIGLVALFGFLVTSRRISRLHHWLAWSSLLVL